VGYSKEELIAKVTNLIHEETGIPESLITPTVLIGDELDIDSISVMTILVNVEEATKTKIPDEDWSGLTTVEKIVDYILNKETEN